ncbi:MAG: hypothetical protein AMJ79_03765 [Phycisphaerae bacterium SM23_30]|nr:MAG: hypothetical protein AMJ79_03765 [Phycisphaerae bacterium SM23_30]
MKIFNSIAGRKHPLRTTSYRHHTFHLESLEPRILLSGNDPFSVDISYIYYQDNAGREIDYDFSAGTINAQDEINLPVGAIISTAADDAITGFKWMPADGDIEQELFSGYAAAYIAQPQAGQETDGVLALLPVGTEGSPAADWTMQMTIGPFSGVDQVEYLYEIEVGAGSYDDDIIWPAIIVEWFTGTYEGTYYDHALVLSGYVEDSSTGQEWETDPVILTGYDPAITNIDLRIEVDGGTEISGSYRINNEPWELDAFELSLPSGIMYGFPELYPFIGMFSEAEDEDGYIIEVFVERGFDVDLPGSQPGYVYMVDVEGINLDLMSVQTPWGQVFDLSDYIAGTWEGGPLDFTGDGWQFEAGTDDDGTEWMEVTWEDLTAPQWAALDTGSAEIEVIYDGGDWSGTVDFDQADLPDQIPQINYPSHGMTNVALTPTVSWQKWQNPQPDSGVFVGIEKTQGDHFVETDGLLTAKTESWTVTQDKSLEPDSTYELYVDFINYDYQIIDQTDVFVLSWMESDVSFTTGAGNPGPDLIGYYQDIILPDVMVPSDKGKAIITVANVGDQLAQEKINIHFYASADQTVDADDFLMGSINNKMIKLNPGDDKTFKTKLTVPLDIPAGAYYLLASIDDGNALAERDETNNIIISDGTGQVVWQFGIFADRKNVKLRVQQDDGLVLTFIMKGEGFAKILGDFNFEQLLLVNTTDTTSLTVKTKDVVTLNQIAEELHPPLSTASLNKFIGKKVNLNGNVDFTGSLGQLVVNNIADGVQFNTALPSVRPLAIKANEVGNVLFDLAGPVKSFQANSFSGGRLSADSIGQVKIKKGDLGADIQAENGGITGVTVGGNIFGDIVALEGSINKVVAKKGNIGAADISAQQDIGIIQANNVQEVVISAGADIKKVVAKGYFNGSYILAGYDRSLGGMLGLGSGDVGSVSVTGTFSESYISAGVLPPAPNLTDVLPGVLPPYSGLGYHGNIGKVKLGAIDQFAADDFGLFAAETIKPVKVGKITYTQSDPLLHFMVEDLLG